MGDQRSTVQEREHLVELARGVGRHRELARAQVRDRHADFVGMVAEHAAAAMRRETRVHEFHSAVQVFRGRPVVHEREPGLIDLHRRAELAFTVVERKRPQRSDERDLRALPSPPAQRDVEPIDDAGGHDPHGEVTRRDRNVEAGHTGAQVEARRAAVHRRRA